MNADLEFGPLIAIALMTVRTFALMMTGPLFGHASVPVRVRVSAGIVIVVALLPVVPTAVPAAAALDGAVGALAIAVATETLIGVTLGFTLQLIFMAFAGLGELISIQGGLGAASVLDPSSGSSTVVLGVLFQATALVIFLAIDGHHQVIRGLAASFTTLPVGASFLPAELFASVSNLGSVLFDVTARLAAPVTMVMLVANVGVGVLGRAIPQLNLMALQLPGNIAVILLIIGLAAGPFSDVIAQTLAGFTERALLTFTRAG